MDRPESRPGGKPAGWTGGRQSCRPGNRPGVTTVLSKIIVAGPPASLILSVSLFLKY